MNIFNRVVMILLIPLTGLVVTAVALLYNQIWEQLIYFVDRYRDIRVVDDTWARLLFLGVAMVIDFILLILWLFEIRRAPQRMIRVRRATGGEVRLPVDSIAERLRYHIDQVSDVIDVRPRIGAKGGAVDVHVYVTTGPDVDVPTKADEIINLVQWVVREKLGLQLNGEPKVELRTAPYPQTSHVEPQAPPAAR